MPAGTASYDTYRQGETISAKAFTFQLSAGPTAIAVASALFRVRSTTGKIIFEATTGGGTITISGAGSNVVTVAAIPAATSATFPVGDNTYALEIVRASDSAVKDFVDGLLPIRTRI